MIRKRKFKRGKYLPDNPKKYIGPYPIVYRSSWELKMNQYFDRNPLVLKWASEPFAIPYRLPDGTTHRYFPDYYIELRTSETIKKLVIEVKPLKETRKPRKSRDKKDSTKLYEERAFQKNTAKWKFCRIFCKKRGYEFTIFTEREIFPEKYKAKKSRNMSKRSPKRKKR